ncbi:MAG: nucleotidyltransferase substrate binding protein [Chthonomonadales bacterium]
MTDYSKLQLALKHLEQQLANLDAAYSRTELTSLDREAIAESTIQRFETAYDTCWKSLKRYLVEVMGVVDIANSPKPILREANVNNLLNDRIVEWLVYADARTATAHDYSGTKAAETLAIVPSFMADAIDLYQMITGTPWQ